MSPCSAVKIAFPISAVSRDDGDSGDLHCHHDLSPFNSPGSTPGTPGTPASYRSCARWSKRTIPCSAGPRMAKGAHKEFVPPRRGSIFSSTFPPFRHRIRSAAGWARLWSRLTALGVWFCQYSRSHAHSRGSIFSSACTPQQTKNGFPPHSR